MKVARARRAKNAWKAKLTFEGSVYAAINR